jgi:hypothetical protein
MYEVEIDRCESCQLKIATVCERGTVLGPKLLCMRCFSSYQVLLHGLVEYVNAHGYLPETNDDLTSFTNR